MPKSTVINNSKTERMLWVDWMKAIGIYFIVAGHFFGEGYKYIYAFNVPVFFLISGFLCYREQDMKVFFKKLLYNMFIPMVLLSSIVYIYLQVHSHNFFDLSGILKFIFYLITGFHSSLKCLWFVYTLICLKLVLQFVKKQSILLILLFILPSVGILLNIYHPEVYGYNIVARSNAIINTTLAYPFFIIGFYLRKYKTLINNYRNISVEVICLTLSSIVLIVSAYYNTPVWMWINGYGDNFLLFILGGLSGSMCILIVSKWMGSFAAKQVIDISKGTIIILAFHYFMIPKIVNLLGIWNGGGYLIEALILTTLFIPIIIITKRYCPILLGKYRA